MKNFKAEYNALVANIINEIITLLETEGLTELTIFEGTPCKNDCPVFMSYNICDDEYNRFIKKVIKYDDKWGIVLFDEYDEITLFPRELTAEDMNFECANCLYIKVYKLLKPKKVRTLNTEDVEALAKLKADLLQELHQSYAYSQRLFRVQ